MQFFLPLCFQFLSVGMDQLKKMAKVQPTLRKFLFEGRCEHLQPEFDIGENSVFLQDAGKASTEVSNIVSCGALSSASESNCVLLNTLSTPTPDPDIAVLDLATTSPSHDLVKKG
jgi:hypothetical protein